MSPQKHRRTFISYSRINKEFALKLALELRSSGFDIWLDQLDIPTGSRWDDEVERALEECEIFMVILTPASSTSDNVKDEIGYAIDSGKRILPILLENAKVPLRLIRFQYVDFTKKSYEEGVESAKQLLRNLVMEDSVPVSVTPPPVEPEGTASAQSSPVPLEKVSQPVQFAMTQVPAQPTKKKTLSKPLVIGAIVTVVVVGVSLTVIAIGSLSGGQIPVTAATDENSPAEAQIAANPSTEPAVQQEPTQAVAPTVPSVTITPDSPGLNTPLGSNPFVESFDDNANGWFTGSDETGSKSLANGNYMWNVQLVDGSDAWQFLNKDLSIADFDLRVDAKRIGGVAGDLCYGLTFRATQKNLSGIVFERVGKYYELEVCDDQSYLISYYDGNDWNYWQDWTDNNVINPNDWNTLEVKVSGTQFEYYINDTKVAKFSDSNLAAGNVGLSVYSYDDVHGQIVFDNFYLNLK